MASSYIYKLCLDEFCCCWNLKSLNNCELFSPVHFVRSGLVFREIFRYCETVFHLGVRSDFEHNLVKLVNNFSLGGVSYVFLFGYNCFKDMCMKWCVNITVLGQMCYCKFFLDMSWGCFFVKSVLGIWEKHWVQLQNGRPRKMFF